MLNWMDILNLIAGKSPPTRVNIARHGDLYEASGTRGTLIIGDPGTGKTIWTAMQVHKQWKAYHDRAVFVFDWSGPMTNAILDLISREPDYEKRLQKVVLDELGNSEYVIPKPEFHPAYGLTPSEQVARVVGNMEKLAEFLLAGAPFLAGISIEELGKNLFRLLMAIKDKSGNSWQLTEGMDLITDLYLLEKAVNEFGGYAIAAKKYFKKQYIPKDVMPPHEKELTTRALRYLLGKIDSREVRASLGYYKPGYTEKEADEKGLLVLIDAHRLINQPAAQHYLIMQRFSQIMAWINKRETDDPNLKPITIALDETYPVLKIPGMAAELGMISPVYRSRKVQLMVIIQALWQLDEQLAKQIWTLGNVVSFGVSNSDEAQEIAKQLFKYDPKYVKNAPKTEYQNPTTENVLGQDRLTADWIQNLKARELIMRRYINEQKKEDGVQFVRKTAEYPKNPPYVSLRDVKDYLLRRRTIPVRDALKVISERSLTTKKATSRRDLS